MLRFLPLHALLALLILALLGPPLSPAAESATAKGDGGGPEIDEGSAATSAQALAAKAVPRTSSAPPPNEKVEDPVQQLPELVISSSRITALDVQIGKLTKKIDRARRRLKKTSSLDESLNTDDIPKFLSILGGYTTGQRKSLARERLMLMEAERSILEAMKHVRTHREEQELKTQLNALKSMALLLEQS